MTGGQRQFRPKGASRASGDALDGGWNGLPRRDRERQQLRAVGNGDIDGALPGVGPEGEETVHASHPQQ